MYDNLWFHEGFKREMGKVSSNADYMILFV